MAEQWNEHSATGQASADELLQEQKKQTTLLRMLMIANVILLLVLLVSAAILIPRTTAMLKNTETSLQQVEELTAQAKESLSGIDEMVTNANAVLSENAEGMNEAIGNFNDVDFAALNQTIRDLSEAVAPLANLVRMFQQ